MQGLVGIFRVESDLDQALLDIGHFKERAKDLSVPGSRMFNPGWHLCADLKSLLTISEAVTRCALARRESRGAHSRIDFPDYDPTWGKQNNIILRRGKEMVLQQRPTAQPPEELQKLIDAEKGAKA
jgi:succinate dehydrogenase / fumarate reductase flavoprotein subunit